MKLLRRFGVIIPLLCSIVCVLSCNKRQDNTYQSGCADNSEATSVSIDSASVESGDSVTIPDSYYGEKGNCTIKIDHIQSPKSLELYRGVASKIDYDKKGLAEYLFDGNEYTYNDVGDMVSVNKELNLNCSTLYHFSYTSGESLKMIELYYHPFSESVPDDGVSSWLDNYKNKCTFDFATEDECISKIVELYKKYGRDLSGLETTVYYLDHTKVAKTGSETDGSFSKDYYIICFREKNQCIETYPFIEKGDWTGSLYNDEYPTLQVYYGSNGIVEIDEGRFQANYEVSDKPLKLLPFSSVIEGLCSWCNGFVEDNSKYVVLGCKIFMSTDSKNELRPIWDFKVKNVKSNEKEESVDHCFDVCIDAVTGDYVNVFE